MLKRLLVPLDTSEYSTVATRMATQIATNEPSQGSHPVSLVGLGIIDLDQIPSGRFAGVVDRDKIISEARDKCAELVSTFKKEVTAAGLGEDRVEVHQVEGSPFREIIRESIFSDLIVMGETCSFPPVNQDYETMKHLYHEASRPILLTHQSVKPVKTVVMAMDGTAPASRMMYHYVHLAPFPQARVVLTYSRREETQYDLTSYYDKVEQYLASYGHQVTRSPIDGDMEDEIGNVVSREDAQVVTWGIHHEHFLDRFSNPLGLRKNFVARLLSNLPASLLLVH